MVVLLFGVDISKPPPPPSKQEKPKYDGEKKKRKYVRKKEVHEEEPPAFPFSLHEKIGLGVMPVFLYQKKLTRTDVEKGENRLFVNGDRSGEKEFLKKSEADKLDGTGLPGIKAVDIQGRVFHLDMKTWPSLTKLVLKLGWHKLVEANGVKEDDVVQIWGYRGLNYEPCLALNFIKKT